MKMEMAILLFKTGTVRLLISTTDDDCKLPKIMLTHLHCCQWEEATAIGLLFIPLVAPGDSFSALFFLMSGN